MESDDLLAAVFPQAAACQDNLVGPREIPDHVLVRQTIDDTLHEALDVDGLAALLRRIESGQVAVHCCETTEASLLAPEIATARPYALLHAEEPQNRRQRGELGAVLAVDLVDRAARAHAIERCTRRSRRPGRPSHDILSCWIRVGEAAPCSTSSRGDAHRSSITRSSVRTRRADADSRSRVTTPSPRLGISSRRRHHCRRASRSRRRCRTVGSRSAAALEHEGFAMRGRYTEDAVEQERRVGRRRCCNACTVPGGAIRVMAPSSRLHALTCGGSTSPRICSP
jgi:hypothetical protein